jgi:hypothetical protein
MVDGVLNAIIKSELLFLDVEAIVAEITYLCDVAKIDNPPLATC